MVPPIPDAIQGGYVVAAVATGLILGGAATIFRELTEGLGCLLGGFCVSMWFLTLKPGGLLTSVPAKAIFIAAFSAGSYGFYFTRYTRPYALMGLMSFAGATVTVIGIDSFSKAGLKEFWAYIWDLNHGLFPYSADTYPLTKGIRVEIALTVVFTIVGIISQLKLWRVIKERRDKKAAEEAEEQRKRDEEEANLGLQIEEQNARERRQWETIYGNPPPRRSVGSSDSGVAAVEEDKKFHISESVIPHLSSSDDEAELAEASNRAVTAPPEPAHKAVDRLIMTNLGQDNRVTIRVASDGDEGTAKEVVSAPDEKTWIVGGDGEARRRSTMSVNKISQMPPKPPGPEITPLPFKIPHEIDGYDDNRSSIATYADEDDGAHVISKKPSRLSIVNRLSVGSGNVLRSLSRQSALSENPKRKTGEFEGSTEELVEDPRRFSDIQSMAATVDGLSFDGDDHDWREEENEKEKGQMPIPTLTIDLGGDISEIKSEMDKETGSETHSKSPNQSGLDVRPTSTAETIATDILDPGTLNISSGEGSKESSTNQGTGNTESTNDSSKPTDTPAVEAAPESSRPPASTVASTVATRVSLTKDRLPSALPRVALSYRTNEWAKHLSAAEAPPLEQLELEEYTYGAKDIKRDTEAAVPVGVEELQQTSDGIIPSSTPRSPSSVSNFPQSHLPIRSVSRASSHSMPPESSCIPSTLAILTDGTRDVSTRPSSDKTIPPNSSLAGHSFRGKGRRQSNEVYIQPIQEENASESVSIRQLGSSHGSGTSTPNSSPPSPTEKTTPVPGVVSYSSPQTLLGKREMFLRNKSQSQLLTSHSVTPPIQEHLQYNAAMRPASQMSLASPYNNHTQSYNVIATSTPHIVEDPDDIPLSQRKEQLIRQNSVLSVNSYGSRARRSITPTHPAHPIVGAQQQQAISSPNLISQIQSATAPKPEPSATSPITYDSHLPHRRSTLPSQAARDAQLSSFRQSVAAEMRTKVSLPNPTPQPQSYPLIGAASNGNNNGMLEMERAMDQQRNVLLSQREQEAQKKELERVGKEKNDRAFEELMRRGDLMDAHREALRRMQGGVKT